MSTSPTINETRFISGLLSHLRITRETAILLRWGVVAQDAGNRKAMSYVGARLLRVSAGGAHSDASAFYTALGMPRTPAGRAQAKEILWQVSETGSELFRAKSLLALGTDRLEHDGKAEEAKRLYEQASKLKHSSVIVPLLLQCQIATANAMLENYREAAKLYRQLLPVAESFKPVMPNFRFHLFNNFAVAQMNLGNLAEADAFADAALSSPSPVIEFGATKNEIAVRREQNERRARRYAESQRGALIRELHDSVCHEPEQYPVDDLRSLVQYARSIRRPTL